MKAGSVTRRCACRDPETGRQYGQACPKLTNRRHSIWYLRQELPAGPSDKRRQLRRGGYTSAGEAQADLDRVRALLALPDPEDADAVEAVVELLVATVREKLPIPEVDDVLRRLRSGQSLVQRLTVGEYLDTWLAGKRKIRRGSVKRYECDIRNHLRPRIGHVRLDRLRVAHLTEMFAAIADANIEILEANAQRRAALDELATIPPKGRAGRVRRKALREAVAAMPAFRRTTGPATRQRIRATLRAALNDAIPQGLITFNPAAHVELDPAKRPKAQVWTEARIERWRVTGERPSPVMVWTPEQTGRFLDHVAGDRLAALWHVIAFRGLRRGEGCGVRWDDVDFDVRTLTVAKQLVTDGWEVLEEDPKSAAGSRVIALDAATVDVLRAHRARQAAERLAWGPAWVDTSRVFTRENGEWLHPGWVSDRFEAGRGGRVAADPAARPSPRRGDARPGGRRGDEDRSGDARPLIDHDHLGHLHGGPAGGGPGGCRGCCAARPSRAHRHRRAHIGLTIGDHDRHAERVDRCCLDSADVRAGHGG